MKLMWILMLKNLGVLSPGDILEKSSLKSNMSVSVQSAGKTIGGFTWLINF